MCSGRGQARLVVRRGLCLAPRGYRCTPQGRSGREFHSSGRRAGMAGGLGTGARRRQASVGSGALAGPHPARELGSGLWATARSSHGQAQGTEGAEAAGAVVPRWRGREETSSCHAGVSLARALGRRVLDKDKVKACVREGLGRGWGSGGEVPGDEHDRPPPQLGTALPLPRLKAASPSQGRRGRSHAPAAGRRPAGATRATGRPAEPSRARARCWRPRAAAASPPAR